MREDVKGGQAIDTSATSFYLSRSEALEHPAPAGQWVYFNMKDEQETQ